MPIIVFLYVVARNATPVRVALIIVVGLQIAVCECVSVCEGVLHGCVRLLLVQLAHHFCPTNKKNNLEQSITTKV